MCLLFIKVYKGLTKNSGNLKKFIQKKSKNKETYSKNNAFKILNILFVLLQPINKELSITTYPIKEL